MARTHGHRWWQPPLWQTEVPMVQMQVWSCSTSDCAAASVAHVSLQLIMMQAEITTDR